MEVYLERSRFGHSLMFGFVPILHSHLNLILMAAKPLAPQIG
jgi:hypothetical protein